MGEEQDDTDDKLRHHVGEDMMEQNPAAAVPQPAGNTDVLLCPDLQHLAADQTGKAAPVGTGDSHQQAGQPFAADKRDENQKYQMGNAHHQINEPVDEGVQPAGTSCGDNANNGCNDCAGGRCHTADGDADGKALDGAQEHIPAQPVGAKQMLPGRRQVFLRKIGADHIVGDELSGDEHGKDDCANEGGNENRFRSAVEAEPFFLFFCWRCQDCEIIHYCFPP